MGCATEYSHQCGTHTFVLTRFLATCICQTHNTLIVDICPQNPSTAAAAGNITRCVLSAAAVAAMQPLLDSMGRGWFFTALALISGVLSAVATFLIRSKGMAWRNKRQAREQERAGHIGEKQVLTKA